MPLCPSGGLPLLLCTTAEGDEPCDASWHHSPPPAEIGRDRAAQMAPSRPDDDDGGLSAAAGRPASVALPASPAAAPPRGAPAEGAAPNPLAADRLADARSCTVLVALPSGARSQSAEHTRCSHPRARSVPPRGPPLKPLHRFARVLRQARARCVRRARTTAPGG